jgi:hybrid cluster-associated redox disulfide protein
MNPPDKTQTENHPAFYGSMTIDQAMKAHPDAVYVMSSYGLTGCSSCKINTMETLDQACQGYGIRIDLLLESLNNLE